VSDRETILRFLSDLIEALDSIANLDEQPALLHLKLEAEAIYAAIRAEDYGIPFRQYVDDLIEDRIRFELTTQGEEAAA
jgi:hypothetical protein